MKATGSPGDSRFWSMELDADTNRADALAALREDRLVGIVDEEAGGIIAYARGDQFANDILMALTNAVAAES